MRRMARGVRWELSQGAERQASLRQHFLSGRFAGRFSASYSSSVPRVLGLAAVSRGRLGLPPVQEACAHLQPPPLQRQAEDNLPEREVPERPLPAAAAELHRDDKVSQGMLRHAPALSCDFGAWASPAFLLTEAVLRCSGFYLLICSLSSLPPSGLVLCSNSLIPELVIQGKHQSSELIIRLDAGADLLIYLFATSELSLFVSVGSQALWRRGPHHF